MSPGWDNVYLGDVIESHDGRRIPVRETDRVRGPYPYYGASGIIDWIDDFIFEGDYLLIAEDGENLRTRQTPVAFMATGQFWVNNHAHIVKGNHRAETRYLMYALQQTNIEGFLTGSAMPKLTQANLHRIPLHLPPLAEQRAIAGILGALDDKIALNRQMNATLESIARALFQSWFVDFDPVRAKAEGRAPDGMDAETAALFPDSFEDSALGPVPSGWRVGALGEVAEFAYGKALKAENRNPGDVPVYGSNGQVGWHDSALVHSAGIIVGRKGNPGTVTWSQTPFFPIDTTFYVAVRESGVPLEYVYFVLAQQDLASLSADSAVPGLNRNLAYGNTVLVPPEKLACLFVAHIRPIFARLDVNERETRTLAELRDALLPKLMSGELRVGES